MYPENHPDMYLNCKTYFSFRYGSISTSQLVKAASDLGITSLAITNINNTCDVWDFVKGCNAAGIKPVAGVEIRNGDDCLYVLIAANNRGLACINRFLSEHLLCKQPFPDFSAVTPGIFENTGDGYIIYPPGKKKPELLSENERIGIRPSEVHKLLQLPVEKYSSRFVVLQPVTFLNRQGYNIHRLLRSIDQNTLLSKLSANTVCKEDEILLPPSEILKVFRNYPQIIVNTYQLIDSCHIGMDFRTDKNKKVFSASPEDDRILLEKLTEDGFSFRYGNNDIARKRVRKELDIINKLGFNAYFLITWDIIRYAQSRGFYYVGRGSGANSIVAYCLQITDVDPIELDLYFERFLNPYRTSPPDFDLDFSWLDRDEVIDYVFKRYGKNYVALLGMYTTFQYRAVVRELGKVFGLPKEELDNLAMKREPEDHIHELIVKYGALIQDFPNHLSIHPGGILISEKPISNYGALFMPPKGFPTIQMDMFVAEDIGFSKLDVLSQRGLGHIKECLRLVKQNKGVDVNIHAFQKFKNDPRVRGQIRNVHTIGCFYIESPAMRQLLQKLKCDDYLTLVAASSIIRPGVASSGMMRAYIERYHSPDKTKYIHPVMKELLKETYGVMVFQEDVIKVAHHFAGLDMGEADILRRAMSGKYRGNEEMLRIRNKFFENCKQRNYPDDITAEVWRQIESFAGYSFSKAHSASFAVESFQSLYLKTYFPKEFMVAVINNFGGFYSTELYFLELRKTGANIHLPCVNESEYFTTIRGNDVYTGFIHLKSLEEETVGRIIAERSRAGRFLHLQDFIERTGTSPEQLNILIRSGAFRFTGKSKKTLLWEANFLQKKERVPVYAGPPLIHERPLHFVLPALPDNRMDDMLDQVELLDFPLCNPFEMADTNVNEYTNARDLPKYAGHKVTVVGYFIDYKRVTTVSKSRMAFGTFLDKNLDWIDTVHFPDSLRRYPLNGRGFYKMTGKVVEDFGVFSIEVDYMEKIGYRKREFANL